MQINRFNFKVEVYFNPPPGCLDDWHGYEVHEESMWASNAAVAARSMKSWVLKKIGCQKGRLSYINISEPELVPDQG